MLVSNPEGKTLVGRVGNKLENNIKMDLKETGYEGVNWIYLAQDTGQWWTLVNTSGFLKMLVIS
jgi:hypothetical protein